MEPPKQTGLALLRVEFPPNQISRLPKPKSRDAPKGYCKECGGYHGLPAVHLDYVGHAALTDRLLDADPAWSWEPLALDGAGLPALDQNGGMWIRLTVCGVTRLGYGDAQGKSGGDAMKERIGDALRNAAMRFGAALALWHKGDLHVEGEPEPEGGSLVPVLQASIEQAKKRNGVVADVLSTMPPLPDAEKEFLGELAVNVSDLLKNKGQAVAFNRVQSEKLTDHQSIYLWGLLDSKVRSALKVEKGLRIGAA